MNRCDADGMLVIAGFCCCDHWEKWDNWKTEDHSVATLSSRARSADCGITRRSRAFGTAVTSSASRCRRTLTSRCWRTSIGRTRLTTPAAAKPTELTGPSGLKMAGPTTTCRPRTGTRIENAAARSGSRRRSARARPCPRSRACGRCWRVAPLAAERHLDAPRGRRPLCEPRALRRGARAPLRSAALGRRLRSEGATRGVRVRASDVRSVLRSKSTEPRGS